MFKHLFPTLLIPVLLLGAGCAQTQEVEVDTSAEAEVMMEEVSFENGTYVVVGPSEERTAASVAWEASKRVGATHNGTVDVKEGALIVEQGQIIGGSIVVDMNTIINLDLTDEKVNSTLVNHLKSDDFFSVATYPTATFAISEVVELNGIEGATHRVDGTMTIKGIENNISFPANIQQTEVGIQVVGTLTLDRTLWDVRFGSDKFFDNLGDGLIEDEFTLAADLLFIQGE